MARSIACLVVSVLVKLVIATMPGFARGRWTCELAPGQARLDPQLGVDHRGEAAPNAVCTRSCAASADPRAGCPRSPSRSRSGWRPACRPAARAGSCSLAFAVACGSAPAALPQPPKARAPGGRDRGRSKSPAIAMMRRSPPICSAAEGLQVVQADRGQGWSLPPPVGQPVGIAEQPAARVQADELARVRVLALASRSIARLRSLSNSAGCSAWLQQRRPPAARASARCPLCQELRIGDDGLARTAERQAAAGTVDRLREGQRVGCPRPLDSMSPSRSAVPPARRVGERRRRALPPRPRPAARRGASAGWRRCSG